MLSDLVIQGFRGIRTMSMSDCGVVNLVVGRNDSGKTSLLEAIRLLMSGDPRHLRRVHQRIGGRTQTSSESRYVLAFYNRLETNQIEVGGTFDEIKIDATAKISEVRRSEQLLINIDEESEESEDSLLEPGKQVEVKVTAGKEWVSLSVPIVESASLYGARQEFPPTRRSFSKGEFPKLPSPVWLGTNRMESVSLARRYSKVYRSGGTEALVKVLATIEPSIEGLVVLTESRERPASLTPLAVLEVKLAGQPSFPLENMGEGFSSIIAIVTAIATSDKGLCLLDEMENGIHYSILSQVWSAAIETALSYDSQIWATTHSFDCISAAYEAFCSRPDLLRVHRMERRDDGEIEVHTFDHEMLGRALERGLEVR